MYLNRSNERAIILLIQSFATDSCLGLYCLEHLDLAGSLQLLEMEPCGASAWAAIALSLSYDNWTTTGSQHTIFYNYCTGNTEYSSYTPGMCCQKSVTGQFHNIKNALLSGWRTDSLLMNRMFQSTPNKYTWWQILSDCRICDIEDCEYQWLSSCCSSVV